VLKLILVGAVALCSAAALICAVLEFWPTRAGTTVRCRGVPGQKIPKGFLVEWGSGSTWITSRAATVGPDGYVDVPAVKE
jgi:hypothetical protein